MITIYSTTWCGYCQRLKSQLDRANLAYTEINIEDDPNAADFVMSVNGGNQTVPTVRVRHDGREVVMTNPSLKQVQTALAKVAPAS